MKDFLLLLFEILFLRGKQSKSHHLPIVVNIQRPVVFPFQNSELHYGFVNSLNNKNGMQAQFYVDEKDAVTCLWQNTASHFQGFSGIIHGGILVALADELMANCLVAHNQKFGVTLSSRIQWKTPVRVGEEIKGKANIITSFKNFVLMRFIILNSKNQAVLCGSGVFYIPTLKQFNKITGLILPDELQSFVRK